MISNRESNPFSVYRADWDKDRPALQYIRALVFVHEQGISSELEWDQDDVRAIHLLAVDAASHPIGTARLTDKGQIGRMAVLPAWRRRGVGRALLNELLRVARELNQTSPFLNAQIGAMPFYLRSGFQKDGEEHMEAGLPHRRMILRG